MRDETRKRVSMAVAAMTESSYVPYDLPDMAEILVDNYTPEDALIDSEQECLINSQWKSMSDEAKQIINIILNSPQEMANLFFTPGGKMVRGKATGQANLIRYLRKQWGDVRYARQVVREIEAFVKLC